MEDTARDSKGRRKIGRNIAIIAGTVLMAGVTAPLIVPIRPLEGTLPPEDLADSDSRFVDVGGLRIHYKQYGAGTPVFLLLHGHLHSLATWRQVAVELGETGSVFAWDRPGFGLTSRPMPGDWKGPNPYSPEAQAALLPVLMDAFGLARATLIGSSTGAAIAALAAERFPERVERLVLVAPLSKGLRARAWQRVFMSTPQMKRLGPLYLRGKLTSELERMYRAAWHDPFRVTEHAWDQFRRFLDVDNWDRALWEEARTAKSFEELCHPRNLQVASLVITGDDDRIAGTESIIRIAAGIPKAHLAVLSDCGHLPQEETPGAFMDALREFFALPADA